MKTYDTLTMVSASLRYDRLEIRLDAAPEWIAKGINKLQDNIRQVHVV